MPEIDNFEIVNHFEDSRLLEAAEKSGSAIDCKFVHLSLIDKHIFVYGPLHKFRYHAQLVESYCQANKIDYYWDHKPDQLELVNSELRINGGGWLKISPSSELLKVYGYSTAYGGFDEVLVYELIKKDNYLSDFVIS